MSKDLHLKFLQTDKTSAQPFIRLQKQDKDPFIVNFQAPINFKRIGWIVFLALTFFNSQFGLLQLNKTGDVETQPQIVKPTQPKDKCGCVKKPKKPKSKKKQCF